VLTSGPADVLGVLGVLGLQARTMTVLKDVPLHNASWLVQLTDGGRVVLRRYHARATAASISYEHAVLRYLADAGWVVPEPVGDLVEYQGGWYCPTRYVPGRAIGQESAGQQRRRGRDLARLHIALRGLAERLGQRPGWHAQHMGVTVDAEFDWDACVQRLMRVSPRLGSWLSAAAWHARDALAALGASELPVLVIHGDFAEWNVHYQRGRLAARFASGMAAWAVHDSLQTGGYDLAMIERQLSRTGTSPPRDALRRIAHPADIRDRSPGSEDLKLCLGDLIGPESGSDRRRLWPAQTDGSHCRDWIQLRCDRRADHGLHHDGLLARPGVLRR
jgi:Phosphotransferase enzyme family